DHSAVAVAESLEETHQILENLMCRDGGVLDWAETHNCIFGLDKFQLTDFTRAKEVAEDGQKKLLQGPPLEIGEYSIKPQRVAKLLGVWIDAELQYREQVAEMIKKGQAWINAFRRLSRVSGGAASKTIKLWYNAIAIPRMLYGAEVALVP